MKNFKSHKIICPIFAALALIFCGCGESRQKMPDENAPVELSIEGVKISAELAVTDLQKARGLMFRESLGENSGMMFVYDRPQKVSYWMKNTSIPLDIGFFTSDGTLTQVAQMYPNNLDSVPSARSDIMYCLETNSGWFTKNNILPPAKLDMRKLNDALNKRKSNK